MNLLLLAGNSFRNKAWIYGIKQALEPLFEHSFVHEYAHWQNNEEFINFDTELGRLKQETKALGSYAIFAKSAGSLLALQGIHQKILAPAYCIFTGLPLALAERENMSLKTWLRENTAPTLLIQNRDDPLGSFQDIEAYISTIKHRQNYRTVELPAESHDYNDLEKLKELASTLKNAKR